MKQRSKRSPTYKQMAFETAIRNPERYKEILEIILNFENVILNKDNLLKIVSELYLKQVVSSEQLQINEFSTLENIAQKVQEVNASRNSDGGFPKGFCSRFWTYMRTLCELGLVYARYEQPLKISQIAKMLLDGKLDEQEVFAMQAVKYNRKSPYRNVSNDFNFFKFLLEVIEKRGRISYDQFIVAMFSYDGNVNTFLDLIQKNTLKDTTDTFEFVKKTYNTKLKIITVTKDYPDVVLRLLLITGFISVQFSGKMFLQINQKNIDLIQDLFTINIQLSEEEKENPILHFQKLETYNQSLLNIIKKHQKNIQNEEFHNVKIEKIIEENNISEKLLLDSIKLLGTNKNLIPAFKYISEFLKLEFFISILLVLKYGKEYAIKPNYKADFLGMPITHASGGKGDIEVFSKDFYWLVEVTLIRNKNQQLNSETSSVIRHFTENQQEKLEKFLSFVAPTIHEDTRDYYDFSIGKNYKKNIFIKPYSVQDFLEITIKKSNLSDMKVYTLQIIEDLRKKFFE